MLVPYGPLGLFVVFALLSPLGCASDASPDFGGAGGGSSTSSSTTTSPTPQGTCKATFIDGDSRTTFDGTARATMNGSGNLTVRCDAADGDAELAIAFGNASFDGPRTYLADDFTSDGSLDYTTSSGAAYWNSATGSSCTLVLTEAGPLDARGDSVVKGGTIAATFSCTKLGAGASSYTPQAYVVENGALAATVE